jgi:NAD(P)-dependent dehydrogenase (short-subunit alcohol dehydrogenase family)
MMDQLFRDRSTLTGTSPEEVRRMLELKIPLQRMARPADIADVYLFLASSLNNYMTGQSIVVDGGWQVG